MTRRRRSSHVLRWTREPGFPRQASDLAAVLGALLESPGVRKSGLARELGVSPAWMTKALKGGIARPSEEILERLREKATLLDVRPPVLGRRPTVFLSSTYLDNARRRKALVDAIERIGFDVVCMERWSADTRPAPEVCIREAAQADVLVGIVAWRYGSVPEGGERSYLELEYDAARERLMFVIDPQSAIDPRTDFDPGPDRWRKQEKLEAFKDRIQREQMATPFTDQDLVGKVVQALLAWRERQGGADSSPTAEDGDGDGGSAPARDPALDAAIERFCDWQIEQLSHVTLAGFETRVRVPLTLDELFVPLTAAPQLVGSDPDAPFAGHPGAKGTPADRADRDDLDLELPLAEAFTWRRSEGHPRRRVVLLGHPGSGKTTQLRRMGLAVLREGPEPRGLPPGTLPLFLPLRELENADLDDSLWAFADRVLANPHLGCRDLVQRLAESGRPLLVLADGLDEVSDPKLRGRVARWLEQAVSTRTSTFLLVSCRFAGYSGEAVLDERFLRLDLRPLDEEQASAFVRNWFAAVEGELNRDRAAAQRLARTRARDLLQRLRRPDFRSARVFELTRNPLILTAICLVHRDRGRLPNKSAKLYGECITVLLERWREAKKLSLSFDADSARAVLQPMALWMHEQAGRTRASRDELVPVLEKAFASLRWRDITPDAFLATIRDESGLLLGWSAEEFGFLHLTFQEYLAAQEIRARAFGNPERELAELARRFGQSWWSEVVRLVLSEGHPPLFEPFFRCLLRHEREHAEDPEERLFSQNDELVDVCLEDSFQVTPAPFIEVLDEDLPEACAELRRAALRALRALDPEAAQRYEPARVVLNAVGEAAAAAESNEVSQSPRGGVELVRVPDGGFWMGSPEGEGDSDEHPPTKLEMSAFWIGKYPVTNEEYARFLDEVAKKGEKVREPRYWADSRFNRARQPVVGVSWEEARAFCEWAGGSLPSEAQWEYACRGVDDPEDERASWAYASGNTEEDLARVGWYDENSGDRLHPVGEKEANAFGLYDMHGNAWEWCEDWFDADWYANPKRRRKDPIGPPRGRIRVIRGGGFLNRADGCRSAYRSWDGPAVRWSFLGFRLVLPAAPSS